MNFPGRTRVHGGLGRREGTREPRICMSQREAELRSAAYGVRRVNTNEIILIHHTRCGMRAFTGDPFKAGLEGDPAWLPTGGPDAVTARGFICDVDTPGHTRK